MDVRIAVEPVLTLAEFVQVLERSGLGARRPMQQPDRLARMLTGADLIVTARAGATLIGVARALCDFAAICYVADLAVDRDWQKRGVGRALLARTREAAGPETALLLLSAPDAMGYYPGVGMSRAENAFIIARER